MRIGLLGASIRAAACGLKESGHLSIGIDRFADRDTATVLGSRCLQARDWRHARSLVMQSARSPRLRSRRSQRNAFYWLISGGLDLEPNLLESLTWSGNRLLGCDLEGIALAKSLDRWTDELRPDYAYLPDWCAQLRASGAWFRKENWPASQHPRIWQQRIDGQLRSAVFLATCGECRLLGITDLYVTGPSNDSDAASMGPWWYLGNTLTDQCDGKESAELTILGEWFAKQRGVQGVFGIDYVVNQHVWPIEINPRPTASLEVIQNLHSQNLWLSHIQAVLTTWQEREPELPETLTSALKVLNDQQATPGQWDNVGRTACKRIVYHNAPTGVFDESTEDRWLETMRLASPTGSGFDWRICDWPNLGATIPAGSPLCTLLAAPKSSPQVELHDLTAGSRDSPVNQNQQLWEVANRLAEQLSQTIGKPSG